MVKITVTLAPKTSTATSSRISQGRAQGWRLCWAILLTLAISTPATAKADNSYAQRASYLKAKQQLANGQKRGFARTVAELGDYPLVPYLKYADLRTRLGSSAGPEVADFIDRYGDTAIAPLLQKRWLKRLGARSQWRSYLRQYKLAALASPSTELVCYQLRALYATGQRDAALAQVQDIWVAGKSLPKACDPIFDLWIKSDHLTADIVWQRLVLALQSRETSLARYLIKLLPTNQQGSGQLFLQAHRRPQTLVSSSKTLTPSDSVRSRQILVHAMQRLLRAKRIEQAQQLWETHQHWQLTTEQQQQQQIDLALARAKQGEFPSANAFDLSQLSDTQQIQLAEGLALAAIRAQQWSATYYWIDQLPNTAKNHNRWQYWLARALQETEHQSERSDLMMQALAQKRDYYGFLAAQHLQQPPKLNRTVGAHDAASEAIVRQDVRFVRATELFAVREFIAAGREWRQLLQDSELPLRAAAARLAQAIGWPRQAIEAANRAKLHDDTDLRFPVLHMAHYQRMSHATEVPVPLLLAVSRQESAFDERARSHANARGLMQLLPSTAAVVARRANLSKPTNTALYRPSTNIEIASHYLATLLARFDGSRPLAIAGYNAGEHRVDRWLEDSADMPMDVWIERIPFKETRNYVQNVLAFTQVYNQKLNLQAPLLLAKEQQVPRLPQSLKTKAAAVASGSPAANRG